MLGNSRKRPLHATDLFLSNPGRPREVNRQSVLASVFSTPFQHHAAYRGHHGCVNALALSPGEGRWLASGGDDTRVILFDALADDVAGGMPEPVAWYGGATSNIFAVDFTCDGTKVISAGNDASIICHDLETGSSTFGSASTESTSERPAGPSTAYIDNDDSVSGLAAHPANPNIFLSACSDGTLRQYDVRTSGDATGVIADTHEMLSVSYHPRQHDLFAYSGEHARAGLLDARMAWSDDDTRWVSNRRARHLSVVNYHAELARSPRLLRSHQDKGPFLKVESEVARPAVSSVAFSPTGSLLCLTISGHLPTLYSLSDPHPLATFSAPLPPPPPPPKADSDDDEPNESSIADYVKDRWPWTYRNKSTTKHGSFGGGSDAVEGKGLYWASGSDDFGVYIWEVPARETMESARTAEGFKNGVWPEGRQETGYLDWPWDGSGTRSVHFPHKITKPSSILRAHRSVVNTALFHPSLPYLYSSGVEKIVVRHSPSTRSVPSSASPSCSEAATSPQPKTVPWRFEPRLVTGAHTEVQSWIRDSPEPKGADAATLEAHRRQEEHEVLEHFDTIVFDLGGHDESGDWHGRRAILYDWEDRGAKDEDGGWPHPGDDPSWIIPGDDFEDDDDGFDDDEEDDDDDLSSREGGEVSVARVLRHMMDLVGTPEDPTDSGNDGSD
ncbi:hypothetical protein JCM10212_005444 [Sporobolomyces blumeae]